MSFITPLSYSDISNFSICAKKNKNELYKIKDHCKDKMKKPRTWRGLNVQ